ncbi:MAG: hypothetical protein GY915_02880 [bacterium]|nr:hypothetical protein [bacterium]
MFQKYLYPISIAGLTAFIYGINATPKLLICSLFFVASLLLLNGIYQKLGTKKHFQAASIALAINALPLLFSFSWMLPFSLFGAFTAFTISLFVFKKFESNLSISWSLFLGFSSAILVDALIISIWEVSYFGMGMTFAIMGKSVSYKIGYSAFAALSVHLAESVLLKNKKSISKA